jgi:hypothetical protein
MKLNFTVIDIADYSPDPSLTEQQHRIIARLACGWSIHLAAKSEKLHRNTVGNWRRTNPAFARELEFAYREQRRYWQDEAIQLASSAMRAISECINDSKTSPSVRFRAAAFIINMATDSQQKATKGQMLAQPKEEPAPAPETENSVVQTAKTEKTAQRCTNAQPVRVTPQPGRNETCSCGSGLKFKRCCLSKQPQALPLQENPETVESAVGSCEEYAAVG